MKLNCIKIENFLSIKKAFVDFEDFSELVHLVGVNQDTKPNSSNGAGKSSIIEAIAFALFGKTIRRTTEKSLKNIHTKGRCKVVITVNDNVIIERTKKPPMLKVSVDGNNCTKESIHHTQKYLEQFLNINQSVFLASIVFGQSNSTNFLTASPEEKRTIIQNFLSVSDIFKERPKIKSLKSHYSNIKKVASTLLDDSNAKLVELKKKRKGLLRLGKEVDNMFSSEKAAFIRNNSLTEIQEKERAYHELELSYETISTRAHERNASLARVRERIKSNKGAACEHCGKVSRKAWEMIQKDETQCQSLEEEMTSTSSRLKKLRVDLEESAIPVSLQDFEVIEKVKGIEVELKYLKTLVKEQTAISKKHILEVNSSQKKYDLMRFWETAFSEQGLVKYVIRNILSFFNERSNYYLGFLTQGNFALSFNELLQDDIKNQGATVFFESLSGGEKKKISLAVMLALNDLLLLTGKARSNVIFFDEIADSLDEEGIKGLYELIQQITASKRLFVITHNDYLASLIEDWSDILLVKKKDHITTVRKI